MHNIIKIDNINDWLKYRSKGIGGSDAACILGRNPHKSNLDLWREKTGRKIPEDISNKDVVKYGKNAEEPLRQLFILDYPQYIVKYSPFNIHCNKELDFIRGTFDAELIEILTEEQGIWECKTSEIRQASDWQKWHNRIPDNYFCQVLHYFAIDEDYKFCKLKAQLKHYDLDSNEITLTTKHYHLKRDDYLPDIEYLINEEIKFNWYIKNDKEPPLILPII